MKPIHILLVEDNEGDIVLTREAFEERKIINKFSVVKNGADAIDFVFQKGKFKDEERPDLILLDINIPLKNGMEVLKTLKESDFSRKIPIIILTTSSSKKDLNDAYHNYANSYITKPLDMADFIKAIIKIEDFWFELVKLPSDDCL